MGIHSWRPVPIAQLGFWEKDDFIAMDWFKAKHKAGDLKFKIGRFPLPRLPQ